MESVLNLNTLSLIQCARFYSCEMNYSTPVTDEAKILCLESQNSANFFFFFERSTKSINKRFKKQFKLCVHIKGLHAVQLVSIDRSKVCKSKSGEKGHKLNTVWFHDGLRYQELKHRVASFLLRHIRVHGHLHYSW